MSTLMKAIIAASIGMGLNTAMAQDVNSAAAKDWGEFQVMLKKCDGMTGAAKKQCIDDARAVYRASDFKCESMTGADKSQCLKLAQRWEQSPSTGSKDAPAVHSNDQSATPPSNPSDPTDELRNRDSRKQQGDAARTLPEPTQKQN